MKRLIKKLLLRRNTIRVLTEVEATAVHAGGVDTCTVYTRVYSGCVGDPTNPKSPPTK